MKLYKFPEMKKALPLDDASIFFLCDGCGAVSDEKMPQIGHAKHACKEKCARGVFQSLLTQYYAED